IGSGSWVKGGRRTVVLKHDPDDVLPPWNLSDRPAPTRVWARRGRRDRSCPRPQARYGNVR
ncbi:MAG: hypothetical protein WBB77_09670, partial [Candidatus Nanopelagicales bacterium]